MLSKGSKITLVLAFSSLFSLTCYAANKEMYDQYSSPLYEDLYLGENVNEIVPAPWSIHGGLGLKWGGIITNNSNYGWQGSVGISKPFQNNWNIKLEGLSSYTKVISKLVIYIT